MNNSQNGLSVVNSHTAVATIAHISIIQSRHSATIALYIAMKKSKRGKTGTSIRFLPGAVRHRPIYQQVKS